MRRHGQFRFIALLMAMVLLAISVSSACAGACATASPSEVSVKANIDSATNQLADLGKHCPSCPDDDHSDSDGCDSSCSCPCHAPLMQHALYLACSMIITPLLFHEPFKFIPEVYLSKFIPPQNRA